MEFSHAGFCRKRQYWEKPKKPDTSKRMANERSFISSRVSMNADFLAAVGGVCGSAKQNKPKTREIKPGMRSTSLRLGSPTRLKKGLRRGTLPRSSPR